MVMHYFIPLNDLLISLNDADFNVVVPGATGPSKPNVFPNNIDTLPTSNLADGLSIHGDNFHEMGTTEDDIQDSDITGYESDTSVQIVKSQIGKAGQFCGRCTNVHHFR